MTDDVIATARERFAACHDHYSGQRALFEQDIRFRLGDQWPDTVKATRGKNRPALVSNQVTRFIRQVTGDARKNKISIKIRPVDDAADIDTARIIQGMVRHIEVKSNATAAYDCAIDHSATCGAGYIRVLSQYCRQDSFDQELAIERVADPLSIYIDPAAQKPCAEDMSFAFISSVMSEEEFKRRYPDAAYQRAAFAGMGSDDQGLWRRDNLVTVCEYYDVVETPTKLYMFEDGSVATADTIDATRKKLAMAAGYNVEPIRERETTKRSVKWRKMTGVEVLDETDVPGRYGYIPLIPVYGEEFYFDGRWHRSGLVRLLSDPGRLRNYALSIAAETVALSPKAPYIGAEGQFEGHEAEWAAAHTENLAYLEYRPVSFEGALVPPPQRATPPVISPGALQLLEVSERDMMGAVGIYQASLGAASNETSGKAILARQREGDTGTYVYHDQLARAVRHVGKVLLDQMPFIYDAERVVQIVGDDEKPDAVKINAPTLTQPKRGKPSEQVLYDVTKGEYDVIVDVGPAYASRRAEALEHLMELVQSVPAFGQVAADVIVGMVDVEGADLLKRRLRALIPPNVLAADDQDEDAPQAQPPAGPPPEILQAIKAMETDFEKLQRENAKLKQQLDSKDQDNATKVEVANISADASRDVAMIREHGQLTRQAVDRHPPVMPMPMWEE